MKKHLLFTILLALFCFSINAQTTFQKAFGGTNNDVETSVEQTTDGGYVIVGFTPSFGAGNGDVYLIKTSANGDTLWTKIFGGTAADIGYSTSQTTDGGYFIAGATASFGAGNNDVYLIKTDGNGDTLWTKTFGGTAADLGYSAAQTTDGGYFIAGSTASFGAGLADVYLIKTNTNGDTLWTKTFGGTNNDYAYSAAQTTDGGYVIAGRTNSFGAGNYDVYLIKTDANGDTLWTKTFGGTGSERANSVQQTTDGGYIIAGATASFGAGGADVFLLKTDANGDTLWTKTFGGINDDYANSVQQTTDGGYAIAGYTNNFGAGNYDAYLIKTDVNGDTLWTRTFGGTANEYANSVRQTTDGGYVIAGETYSFGAGNEDIYLLKTNSNGNSGCNETNPSPIVTTPVAIVTSPATQVSSGGIVGNPATVMNGGGVVTALCSTTVSINENNIADNFVNISPNPFSAQTTISFTTEQKNTTIIITDLLGKEIKTINFTGRQFVIDKAGMKAGIYFVQTTDNQKRISNNKIIIQ